MSTLSSSLRFDINTPCPKSNSTLKFSTLTTFPNKTKQVAHVMCIILSSNLRTYQNHPFLLGHINTIVFFLCKIINSTQIFESVFIANNKENLYQFINITKTLVAIIKGLRNLLKVSNCFICLSKYWIKNMIPEWRALAYDQISNLIKTILVSRKYIDVHNPKK